MTENQDFDREINLKGITYATAGLVLIVIVSAALMWWMLRGFQKYDEKRDLRPTPIEAANPQQPPPAPRLQVAPGFAGALEKSDREDMQAERENEDKTLSQPGWVDQGQGTVRVPIETAMQMVVRRGLGPLSAAPAVIPPPAAPHPQPLSHPLPAPGRGAPPPTQGAKTSAFSPPLRGFGWGW
jgi:hypothetical protein